MKDRPIRCIDDGRPTYRRAECAALGEVLTISDDHRDRGPAAANPVAAWLQSLGLERYAPVFDAHGIDLQSLPLIAESEFAELGVLLGHRRLLLKAIATLDATRSGPVAATLPARDAGRRQLTVLFCDLVGSTALAQRLDAEVLAS